MSDVTGTCVNESGLDITKLKKHMDNGNALVDFSGGQPAACSDVFNVPCDVLIPAALGGVIDGTPSP